MAQVTSPVKRRETTWFLNSSEYRIFRDSCKLIYHGKKFWQLMPAADGISESENARAVIAREALHTDYAKLLEAKRSVSGTQQVKNIQYSLGLTRIRGGAQSIHLFLIWRGIDDAYLPFIVGHDGRVGNFCFSNVSCSDSSKCLKAKQNDSVG